MNMETSPQTISFWPFLVYTAASLAIVGIMIGLSYVLR